MTTKQQHVSWFLEAPFVRMLRMRSASLKSWKSKNIHTNWILLSCNLSVIYSTFHGMDLRNMGNMTRGITWFYEFQQSATFLHFFGKKDDDISFFVIYVQHFTCWAPTLHTICKIKIFFKYSLGQRLSLLWNSEVKSNQSIN